MAKEREPVRRIELYVGPDIEIRPDDLDKYDKEGCWLVSPKIDGMWSVLAVDKPSEGKPNVLKSRDARTPAIASTGPGDFQEMELPLPRSTALVGELEQASQWATDEVARKGFKSIHLFDLPILGKRDLRLEPIETRLAMLEDEYWSMMEPQDGQEPPWAGRFLLVPTYYDHFRDWYDKWIEEGLEGCVLKRRGSVYGWTHGGRLLSGKTDQWLRCKRRVTEDYALIGLGMTPGGKYSAPKVNGKWGLIVDGEMKEVMRVGAPAEYLRPEFVGKLVCEFMGWQRFRSGALQHPQFVRPRVDKRPEECVLRAA